MKPTPASFGSAMLSYPTLRRCTASRAWQLRPTRLRPPNVAAPSLTHASALVCHVPSWPKVLSARARTERKNGTKRKNVKSKSCLQGRLLHTADVMLTSFRHYKEKSLGRTTLPHAPSPPPSHEAAVVNSIRLTRLAFFLTHDRQVVYGARRF